MTNQIENRARQDREAAKKKALTSLTRYKFFMFGYWAGVWVHLNNIIGDGQPNPFRTLVHEARRLNGSK